jgi:uncharacterized protein YegL
MKRYVRLLILVGLLVSLTVSLSLGSIPHTTIAQSSCTLSYDKTASPTTVDKGGVATVTIKVSPSGNCSPSTSPVDAMLVIDRSGSMNGQSIVDAKQAAQDFVDAMNSSVDQVGVVSFASTGRGRLDSRLSQDFNAVKQSISRLGAGGATNVQEGLEIAAAELNSSRKLPNSAPIIIILSDGNHNETPESALFAAADSIKASGIRIVSIGLGNANERQLRRIAATDNDYHYAPTSSKLAQIYSSLTTQVRWAARSMTIRDTLSSHVKLVDNSFSGPVQPTVNGNTITWNVGNINLGNDIVLSYDVVMTDQAGTWPTNDSAVGEYTDTDGNNATITFPVPEVKVKEDCGDPKLTDVQPGWACEATTSKDVSLLGGGFFQQSLTAMIGSASLSIQSIATDKVSATYTGGLSVGTYAVSVTNQCQAGPRTATIADVWTIYPVPHVVDILPPEGYGDIPSEITICGDGLSVPGTEVFIDLPGGETLLTPQAAYGDRCMVGTIPPNLEPGDYTIVVRGPCGEATGTYRVISPALNNDLWGQKIWVVDANGAAICVRGPGITVGAIVNRRGGKEPLQNVTVRFYEGDPSKSGAVEIGDGTIVLMPPRVSPTERIAGYSTSEVDWTPSRGEGIYTIYAVIDPDNAVEEDVEDNNVISWDVQVLPSAVDNPGVDNVAPLVDSFLINRGLGFDTIYDAEISVQVTASDVQGETSITPSGVKNLSFVELVFNSATGAWVPVQSTGWIAYTQNMSMTLDLFPRGGLRYLQAWSSDAEGNISRYPYSRQINLSKRCNGVSRNGTDVYREKLAEGQQVYVEVIPCKGDPDLYIWPPDWDPTQPDGGRPPYVSNQENIATEVISFTAPIAGVYAVEVYGYTASEYNIQIEPVPTTTLLQAISEAPELEQMDGYISAGISQEKSIPDTPVLPADSAPPVSMGVVPAPATLPANTPNHQLYLPAIQR